MKHVFVTKFDGSEINKIRVQNGTQEEVLKIELQKYLKILYQTLATKH